jgi:putative DNA primase/helicase
MIGLEQALSGTGFAEAREAVFRLVGRTSSLRTQVATYDYKDEAGPLLFQTVRYEPKDFKQRRPDGRGGWIWDLKGVRLVPYHLPELLRRPDETLYICEGEKDVHALEALGLLATCNPMGAGKWRDEYARLIRGRRAVIVTDNDPATDEHGKPHYKGQKHAATAAASLLRHGCEVRIIEPPRGKDAADWLAAGGSLEEVLAAANAQGALTTAMLNMWSARWEKPLPGRAAEGDWATPLVLQSELPAVQAFHKELLPVSFRPLVRDIADRMQVPMDYPSVALLLCLAGVVSRRATIQPKAKDTGWIVVPNLWGGIIAPPGFMKSPVIQAATRPLAEIQKQWQQEHEAALNHYALEKEEFELRRSGWREQYKSNLKYGKAAPERPADEPEEPRLRRLIINDATFEALHQTMSENPAGILVIRDELTGWLAMLDRSGREGERAFALQAWNGDTGHTIDRIGRGSIHVEACCMSMLGGIQPGRLRSYLADALHDGPSNDGLIQRFQLLVWPDIDRAWQYVDRLPDASLEAQLSRVFQQLLNLDCANPLRFRFDEGAQQLFVEWLGELEAKLRGSELHPALVSHLSKYRKLLPALALLFELADRAASGFDFTDAADLRVSLEHAKQAAAFCEYLESHANRIYSCVTTPQMRAARELADKIKARKIGADGFFNAREVYLKGWSGLDSPEAARSAVQVLIDAGWIREAAVEQSPSGGRPSFRYQVNPRLWK